MAFKILFANLTDTHTPVPELLLNGLNRFQTATENQRRVLREAATAADGARLEIHSIPASNALSNGAGLQRTRKAGIRIAAGSGASAVAADIYTMERGGEKPLREGTARLACVRTGTNIAAMMRAVRTLTSEEAPDLFKLPNGVFTARLLSAPALFVDSLWLEPENGRQIDRRIFPYHTVVPEIHLFAPMNSVDFFTSVRPIAEYWRDFQRKGIDRDDVGSGDGRPPTAR